MKNIPLITLLFCFLFPALKAQSDYKNMIGLEGGLHFTYPRYNPSGNYSPDSAGSVINKAKDTVIYGYGLNGLLSYSRSLTTKFFLKIGLNHTFYRMETEPANRASGVPFKDSVVYSYAINLRSIELPFGIFYHQPLKRSFAFAGVLIHTGYVYSRKFVTVTRDYTTLDAISTAKQDLDVENVYFGISGSFGFSQYLGKHMNLVLAYKIANQFSKFSVSDYFSVNFKSQSFHLGLTYKF